LQLTITRTVCLIGLSRFLLCSYHQDKFVMVLEPGHAPLLTIKFQCTLTVFWLRSTLYRDTAPVPPTKYVTGDKFAAPIKLCTATLVKLNKLCTWMAKTRAKPSLHRDSFSAPLARGTRMLPGAVVGLRLLKHTAGPLGRIVRPLFFKISLWLMVISGFMQAERKKRKGLPRPTRIGTCI